MNEVSSRLFARLDVGNVQKVHLPMELSECDAKAFSIHENRSNIYARHDEIPPLMRLWHVD